MIPVSIFNVMKFLVNESRSGGLTWLDVSLDAINGGACLFQTAASLPLVHADSSNLSLVGEDIPDLLLQLWGKWLDL